MNDLSAAQRAFLEAFTRSDLASQYYLSGGTALSAFYLHHRTSEDLDLFTRGAVDSSALLRLVGSVAEGPVVPRRLADRFGFIVPLRGETVRVEFVRYDHPAIEAPAARFGALRVDGLRDILANKLSAIVDRNEPKDFADVYCLLSRAGLSLEQGIADAKAKFGWPALELLQSAFLRIDQMTDWPALDPPADVEEARRAFRGWARSLIRLEDDEPSPSER
ncbi:MAG: nucleotidyl transferase AbiEii/AbiGii toxin family protein [Deltaproteobacteria bacterium]|nr:nucleotidyl transferase AbiEii/AbiGii toxin family protein [Deltaproteobacteria bacterium]